MTRILAITNWYPPHHYGGYEISCHDVMTRLVERGHDVRVLSGDERLPDAAAPDPAHESRVRRELRVYMRGAQLYRPRFGTRLGIERHNHAVLERQLYEHQPDVVSVWHMGAMSLGLLRRLSDRGVPVVYSVCDDWLTYGEQLDAWTAPFTGGAHRRLLGRAVEAATGVPTDPGNVGSTGAFCFISDCTRRRTFAHSRWSYDRTGVVFNGIDRGRFPHVNAQPDRAWNWQLLFTGRFDPRKGIETALRSLAHLPEASLVCDGRGSTEERERFERIARDLGVADRVTFTTSHREALAAQYRAADAFLFPSEWDEPFGLTPLEAMACGTPVVASGTGGSAEFLRDGFNCVLFEPGDPGALAAAVRRLHSDHELRREVVRGGFHTAEQLDVEHLTDALEAWHVAAADGYAHGVPPDRHLDLPAPAVQPVAGRA